MYTYPFAILCCPAFFENCSASRDMRAQLTALLSTLLFRLGRQITAQLRRWRGALAHGGSNLLTSASYRRQRQRERERFRYERGTPNTCVKATSSYVNDTAYSLSTCPHVMGTRSRACTSKDRCSAIAKIATEQRVHLRWCQERPAGNGTGQRFVCVRARVRMHTCVYIQRKHVHMRVCTLVYLP